MTAPIVDPRERALRDALTLHATELALKDARIAELEHRLEIHASDGSIAPLDGIACRDETIRLLERENERLRDAIVWALGAHAYDGFRERGGGDGPYWWRTELRQRAGLRWDGEQYVKIDQAREKG